MELDPMELNSSTHEPTLLPRDTINCKIFCKILLKKCLSKHNIISYCLENKYIKHGLQGKKSSLKIIK